VSKSEQRGGVGCGQVAIAAFSIDDPGVAIPPGWAAFSLSRAGTAWRAAMK